MIEVEAGWWGVPRLGNRGRTEYGEMCCWSAFAQFPVASVGSSVFWNEVCLIERSADFRSGALRCLVATIAAPQPALLGGAFIIGTGAFKVMRRRGQLPRQPLPESDALNPLRSANCGRLQRSAFR